MDDTLGQILSELYQVVAERDRLRVENAQLRTIIDSGLPVTEVSAEELAAAERVPNGPGPQAIATADNDQKTK